MVKRTKVMRVGPYSLGVTLDKTIIKEHFGWDTDTKLDARYDFNKKQVIFCEAQQP